MLIQPKRLIFAHGIYSMTAFDLVTRELAEYQIDGTDIDIVEPYLKRAPQIKLLVTCGKSKRIFYRLLRNLLRRSFF